MIEKVLTGDRRYWTWVIFLFALMGAGGLCYLRQFNEGLGITGLGRDVTWGFYIAQFTFLVGVAASAVMVVLPYYLHDFKSFGKVTILGEFVAISAVLMCVMFIGVDLGQPLRGINIFRYPSPRSVMFWDAVALMGYLVLNTVIAYVCFKAEQREQKPPAWIKPVIYLSIPWAISIHTVTAFLYSGLSARPFWMTAILAPRFLASAFAAGPALLIIFCLVLRRVTKFDAGETAIRKLAMIMTYAMLANVFFVLMEVFTAMYSKIPEHLDHFKYLYFGLHGHNELVPWMWSSAALAVLSLVLLLNKGWKRGYPTLAFACITVVVSIWIEKGLGMVVTGFVPSPLHTVASYVPTLPEVLIGLAIYAFGALLITIFYKMTLALREELKG